MSRWLSVIPLVVLAALAVLFVGWSLKRDPAVKPDALVGQPIPETVLPMLTGDQAGPGHLDLKTAGVGRPMLVNVFASWCAPCRVEHPQLMALKERGVAIVWAIPIPSCWSTATAAPGSTSASPARPRPSRSTPWARSWPNFRGR